jgi:hypothetical protein
MADLDKTDPLASMLGDGYTKLDQAGKVAAAGSFLKSRDEAEKAARGEAGKRAEGQIISEFGPSLYSKPYEEFKPSQESMSGFAALGSLMMVAGTMMGSNGRLAGIGAMNNIAGMLKGYQQGRKDLYEQERQQFEENMKIQERNRADIKEAFNLALKMAPTNLRGAEDFLNKTFASKGMTMPQAMLKTSGVMHTIGTVNGALDRADDITKQIADSLGYKGVTSRKDLEARIAAQAAGTTAQSAAEEAARKKRLDESLIAEREAAAKIKAEPTLDVGPYAKTIISHQSPEKQKETTEFLAGKKTLDAKERDRLDTAKVMMDDSERVARYIAENPDATGMLGQALGRSESVLGFFRGPPKTMDELQSKIDNGLDQIAKSDPSQRATAQKAAVLNKMLAALSLKDASATGRPTVFLERMISRWYNQGYPPDTLIDIIKERAGEANSVLSNYKLDTSRNTPDVNKQMYPLASSSVDDFLKQYRKAPGGAGLNELSSAQKTGIQKRIDQVNNDTSLTAANKKDLKEKIKKQIADGKFSDSGLSWGD